MPTTKKTYYATVCLHWKSSTPSHIGILVGICSQANRTCNFTFFFVADVPNDAWCLPIRGVQSGRECNDVGNKIWYTIRLVSRGAKQRFDSEENRQKWISRLARFFVTHCPQLKSYERTSETGIFKTDSY